MEIAKPDQYQDIRTSSKKNATGRTFAIVLTIGHSTRTLEEFIGLLQAHGVTRVVDVRTVPRSRHNPQFNKDSLPDSLKKAGLRYVHIPGLGGLRHAKRDSLNLGWRNASFRGYADYMQTPEFAESLEELNQLANQGRIALMCAEALRWRCHRSLIADALTVRNIRTEDIMNATHRLTLSLLQRGIKRGRIEASDGKRLVRVKVIGGSGTADREPPWGMAVILRSPHETENTAR